ncbi:MAG TPA: T9SS type A sorting domain-containing protein [Bacteroidales bacterium]|nr:T9SS type A sorting domain-containing protein [Bacteroidales bacterium]
MKKFYKTFLLLTTLIIMSMVSYSQPGNLHYGIMGMWGDAALIDRGVTSYVSIQSPIAATCSFLFNPSVGNYNPKWCGSTTDYTRAVNTVLEGKAYYYTSGGWDADMTCPVVANNYYTIIVGKNPTANNDMSILETSYNPVAINAVTQDPVSNIAPSQSVTVTVTLSAAKNAAEKVFVRYSIDNWATSAYAEITSFNASFQGTATIPGQAANTTVSYYALTTNQATTIDSTIDYYTLRLNNNTNSNYSYTVTSATGISENVNATIDIYPNPVTNLFTLKLINTKGKVDVIVSDISGRPVITEALDSEAVQEKTFMAGHLPAGIYILEAENKDFSLTRKLIIK